MSLTNTRKFAGSLFTYTHAQSLAPPFDRVSGKDGGPQDVQNQAGAGQEAASEPFHSTVDAYENREHHQVQLEAEDVAENKIGPMMNRNFALLGAFHHSVK